MGILSGIVSYIFGLALNLLDTAINGFLGALGFDLDTFETFFPAAKDYYEVLVGFGIGLLFILLIFQIFRNFGIMLDIEAEDPLKLLGKTALFYGMIISSRSITNIILGLLSDPYSIFLGAASDPYEFELMTLVTAMFSSVFSNPFMNIVAIILMLVLGWQFLKLTIECVERYIVFYFVLYTAPVVFATGAFKSTGQIFKSWCRMLGSQAMLLLLNVWSIKLFLSYLPVLESGADQLVFNFLIGYAFLKFAQKADTLLRILGLNTASTGDMMRSLGSTVASIAFAVKSVSGMAGTAASAIGKILGGGASAAANVAGAAAGVAADAAGNAANATGSAVSGMAGFAGAAAGSAASAAAGAVGDAVSGGGGGVTGSGMNAAKSGYVHDVLNAANSQMQRSSGFGSFGGGSSRGSGAGRRDTGDLSDADSVMTGRGQSGGSDAQESPIEMHPGGASGQTPAQNDNPAFTRNSEMQPDGTRSGSTENPRVDAETQEGLSNLAHGIPHNHFDTQSKTWSGGGFPEFTGANANTIGASQLTPAEGFEQHGVKLRDGSLGTLYQNSETGEAHLVQFGSVDNGVIQGSISEVDKATGQFGDFMAFKAVHSSVPGAESFSGHSTPISDSEGGVYHVSTGADTSFLAGASSPMTGAAGTAAGAATPSAPASGIGGATVNHSTVSAHDTSTIHTSSIGTSPATAAPSTGSGPSASPSEAIRDSAQPASASSGITVAPPEAPGSSTVTHESVNITAPSAASPPPSTPIHPAPDEARRFSRNNPANMEIFRREPGGMESFDRSQQNPDSIPKMDPTDKQ